jgi:hypothetical protein
VERKGTAHGKEPGGGIRLSKTVASRLSQNELSGRTGVDEHKLAGFFLIYRDLQALTTDVSEA